MMAVLAGFVSFAEAAGFEPLCCRMLAAQAGYGSGQAVTKMLGAATFAGPADESHSSGGARQSRWLVAADARIDNRQDLIGRLGGQALAGGEDDAALLLAAWAAYGAAGLDAVVGEYAFAIFDGEDQALILARDCSGERPLFYARGDTGTAFASMPSGLRAVANHPPSLSALSTQLSGGSIGDQTVFAGIERVRPGEYVRITSTTLTRDRHWRPQLYHQLCRTSKLTDADYIDRYRHLLTEAVACRLPDHGERVASQLSSGWDSNAVTATAALLRPASVTAFTSAPARQELDPLPRGRIADESGLAALTARRHRVDHVIVRQTAPLFDVVRRQTALLQAPATGSFNLAWWEAIRTGARECGATHLLTGELGNLTLNAGGLPILAEWARRSMWRTWWREARAAARRSDVRWRGILVNSFGHRMPPSAISALRRHFLGMPPEESISFLRKEWREQAVQDADREPTLSGDPYRERLAAIRRNDSGVVRKSALAQAGIQELDPTADRRLIEFSLMLQPEQLLRHGQSRPLARAALADRVPAEILDLRVRGLQAADWYLHFHQREAFEVLEEIEPNPAVRDLLDVNRIARAIEEWPNRDWNSERHVATYRFKLMGALATGIFLNQFRGQPS